MRGRSNTSRPWRFTNTIDVFFNGGRAPYGTEDWTIPQPRTGRGMAGMRIHPKYREFLHIRTNKKLEENKYYLFEMYVKSASHTAMLLQSIGASIYHRKPAYTSKLNLFKYPPQIQHIDPNGIVQTDSVPWVKIRGYYRAKGGEKYLSIGNFETTKFKGKLTFKGMNSAFKFPYHAYYYIDDISLVETDSEGIPLYLKKDTTLVAEAMDSVQLAQDTGFYGTPDTLDFDIKEQNYIYTIEDSKSLVLEKIRFEFGSDDLLPYSYGELELVLEYLNSNRYAEIDIVGHTDDVGNKATNQRLSERRAKSVYNYFLDNRVRKERLSYRGEGEENPIASNENNQGRNQNRRVEIILKSKNKKTD